MADVSNNATVPKIHSDSPTSIVDQWAAEFEASHAAYHQKRHSVNASKPGLEISKISNTLIAAIMLSGPSFVRALPTNGCSLKSCTCY